MKLRSILLSALALLAVSCVYPFEAETQDGSGTLVIEGDILIGEITEVKLSYTAPIPGGLTDPVYASRVWVEDNAGGVYEGSQSFTVLDRFEVDTRDADPAREYRLHVMVRGSREYVSSWGPVNTAPVIDSLSFIKDPEKSRLNIALSMHSKAGSFFKWSYVEDWEYRAKYYASVKYVPPTYYHSWSIGEIVPMNYPENTYWCYKHDVSSEILTFSTEKQTDDRFVDLEFHKIPRDDDRISYIYRIKVNLEPLSKDAYVYWDNLKVNSEYNGNLFAPTPSEMVGNIRCVQDPDELVMGYISVAQRTSKTLYVYSEQHGFYKDSEHYEDPVTIGTGEWSSYLKKGFLPYQCVIPGDYSQTIWAPQRCVDCRTRGGTRTVPDDWPTNH